jgi:hypothetical protein
MRHIGHLWETSVEDKEDLSVLMLACCGSLVVDMGIHGFS